MPKIGPLLIRRVDAFTHQVYHAEEGFLGNITASRDLSGKTFYWTTSGHLEPITARNMSDMKARLALLYLE